MAAESMENEPLSPERLRAAPLAGLVFTLDVPKVPAGARGFDRMMEIGRHLAQALDASVVDDNRAPLTDAGVKMIREQLRGVQAAMDAHGIPAGSALAARLFS
jgi:FtsZ-interacting cell division protein ZipA